MLKIFYSFGDFKTDAERSKCGRQLLKLALAQLNTDKNPAKSNDRCGKKILQSQISQKNTEQNALQNQNDMQIKNQNNTQVQNDIQPQNELCIQKDANGKPFIEGSAQFNISHTDKLVVCAVSDKAVGIDAEQSREGLFNAARKLLDHIDNISLADLTRDEQLRLLLKRWVMAESVCKKTGEGIAAILKSPLKTTRIKNNLYKTPQGDYLYLYELKNYAICAATCYKTRPKLIEIQQSELITIDNS